MERMRIFYGSGWHYSRPLNWLEGHLDQPLSLDNVAAKAGYSSGTCKRMFKDVTGHAIGATSALAAYLNPPWPAPDGASILDIALQYRSILSKPLPARLKSSSLRRRRYIAVLQNGAPLAFVRRCVWVSSPCLNISLSPWKIRNCSAPPRAIPVRWSKSPIFDTKSAYSSGKTFSQAPTIPPLLYGLNETRPSLEKDDEQEVFLPPRYRKNMPTGMCRQRSLLPYKAANM